MNQYGILSYLSRSGSTFLSDKLNRYRDICVTLEASFPPELLGIQGYKTVNLLNEKNLRRFIKDIELLSKVRNWELDNGLIIQKLLKLSFPITGIQVFKTYLDCFKEKYKPYAKAVIYKGSPVMPWTVPQLLDKSNQFKVIYLQRDPRAIYSSQIANNLPYSSRKFTQSPFEVGLDWKNTSKAVEFCDSDFFLKVRYENLIGSSKGFDEIIHFLNVHSELDNNTFDYSQILPKEERSIHSNINKPRKAHYIDKWRDQISPEAASMIDWLCKDYLMKENYEIYAEFDTNVISQKYVRYVRSTRIKKLIGSLNKMLKQPSLYLRRLKLRH
ncbi:sulfotransferase [Ekhidna sp. To15]|uniref:sulfotransferase n=1 Tax=Ekhidna sp. To15 TaxID=3395267 RepID=UPI003F525FA8